MKKQSCRNCHNIDLNKKEETEGRLSGRYRYGCTVQRSGFISGFIISDEKLEALVCPNWKGGKMEEADYERLADEFGERLQTLYDRWNMWKIRGCPEADVPDGEYLNRLRSGIEAMMRQIENTFVEADYPECYYAPLPPVMDVDYMANCQQIKETAIRALEEYRNNKDYLWLADHIQHLDNEDKENSEAYRLLCHVQSLEEAICEDAYLQMKRVSFQESLYDDLANCKRRILKRKCRPSNRKSKKNSPQIVGQLRIGDLKAS